MPENRIGIVIDTKTTGNEGMREHVQQLNQMNAGWGQFNDLRLEASRQFPDDLKKQNQYIREQIGLLSRLEQVGHQERMADMAYQRSRTSSSFEQERIDKVRYARKKEHIQDVTTGIQAEAYRKEWQQTEGIGGAVGSDMLTDLTGMGIRGIGPGGMARMGLGKFAGAVTGRMKGLGTAAKLGLGVGAGAVGFLGYKMIAGAIEGKEAYKRIAPDLMMIQAMTGRLAGDAAAFREEFETVALLTGTMLPEMSQLEQSYIRITGRGPSRAAAGDVINLAQSFGIEKALGMEFTARTAMMGYAPGDTTNTRLIDAIREGVRSGMGEGRLPEFLQGVMSLTDAVMRTSVTADPGRMANYAGRMGVMGIPFQGQRGIEQLSAFNQAITGGGMGFQAARRILDRELGAGQYSIGQVMALQEQGLQDPRLLREMFSMAGEIGGKNPWNQAMLLSKWTGGAVRMKALYNPDKEVNSWLELQRTLGGQMQLGGMTDAAFDRATKGLPISAETRALMKELATPEGIQQRIEAMQATTGFEANQREIATQIGKIEVAAFTFERANEVFLRGALAIAEAGLGSEEAQAILNLIGPPAPIDEATLRRRGESPHMRIIGGANR